MRLIDLDEFLRENCVSRETAELFPGEGQSSCDGCDLRTLEVSCERMLEFPTIDPVKHGRWKKTYLDHEAIGERPSIFYCSVCNQCIAYPVNYCPSCGALMREDGEEDG